MTLTAAEERAIDAKIEQQRMAGIDAFSRTHARLLKSRAKDMAPFPNGSETGESATTPIWKRSMARLRS